MNRVKSNSSQTRVVSQSRADTTPALNNYFARKEKKVGGTNTKQKKKLKFQSDIEQ